MTIDSTIREHQHSIEYEPCTRSTGNTSSRWAPRPHGRELSFLLLLSVFAAACGEESDAAPVGAVTPTTVAEAAPAASAEPVAAAPASPAARLIGTWDMYMARAPAMRADYGETEVHVIVGDETILFTYTVNGPDDDLTVHTVDSDGDPDDTPLRLFGANGALLGEGEEVVTLARQGVDLRDDPGVRPLHGTWRWEGVAHTFRSDGTLTTNNGNGRGDVGGGYRVLGVDGDGVLVLQWTSVGERAIGHSLVRYEVREDALTRTSLTGDYTQEWTRG